MLSQVLSGRFQQGRTGLITTCVMARVPARRTAHAKPFIAAFPITFIMHFTMPIVQNHIRQSAQPAKLSPNPSIPLPASLSPHLSTGFPQSLHMACLHRPPAHTNHPQPLQINVFIRNPHPARPTALHHTSHLFTHISHTFSTYHPCPSTPLRQRKTPALPIGKAGEFSWECDQEAGWPVFRTINQTQPSEPMVTDPASPPHQPTTPGT